MTTNNGMISWGKIIWKRKTILVRKYVFRKALQSNDMRRIRWQLPSGLSEDSKIYVILNNYLIIAAYTCKYDMG